MLLCCTECGRFKSSQFPLAGQEPLLIDPTELDPWLHLDFDPATGNVVAAYDPATGHWSARGRATADVLHLDRREALAASYIRTYRRLNKIVRRALTEGLPDAVALATELVEADDHGLLGWCFRGTGRNVAPFRELREQYPQQWALWLQEIL